MKKKTLASIIAAFSLTFILSSCSSESNKEVIKQNYLLGTVVEVKAYGKNAEKATEEAMKKIAEVDDKMSVTKPTSEISLINKNAGKAYVKVSDDTFYVIKKSLEYSKLSKGAFDITIGPLSSLWGIGTDKANLPKDSDIKERLKLINYNDVLIKEDTKEVKLKNPNQAIDLGGIAKGYTADLVKDILEKNKIKTAFINLGGNVLTVGKKLDGSLWNIGVQDPLKERGEYFAIAKVGNKSVVSSGNYERFFMKDGKRYHHILNTKTGYPSESGIIATTIISDKSVDGDALSTSTFVLGVDEGMKLIESLDGVEAVFITADKKVYYTSGLKDHFKITNEEYKYEER
ncbi:MAG: FAD:protein FMN transferase [Clostridium lundense]|nr:FAD:protein FMN transferase [Clostridium lundense]